MNPRDKNTKKEIDPNFSKLQISSSRHWTNNKNPRIVRVSRAFGGKDRHSKVCTIRGLRDRRIRLSVPTAVQLYDLQERLGLGQPSKVVDWLIEATKDEIDKLPPLPLIPQFEGPSHPVSNTQQSVSNSNAPYPLSHFFQPYATKELGFMNQKEQENQENEGLGGFVAQNLFPLSNFHPTLPNMAYNFQWDPQSLSLSRFGQGFSFSDQTGQDPHHYHGNGSLSVASSSNMPSVDVPQFHPYNMAENIDLRSQNYNDFVTPTTLRLISSPMRSRTVHSPESDYGRESDKGNINS